MLLHPENISTLRHHLEPDFEHHPLRLAATIVTLGAHLRTATVIPVVLRDITFNGAVLELDPTVELPDNFFLEIEGIHDEIGCTKMRRSEDRLDVQFNMLMHESFLALVLDKAGISQAS